MLPGATVESTNEVALAAAVASWVAAAPSVARKIVKPVSPGSESFQVSRTVWPTSVVARLPGVVSGVEMETGPWNAEVVTASTAWISY